jgi:hypothetical protein
MKKGSSQFFFPFSLFFFYFINSLVYKSLHRILRLFFFFSSSIFFIHTHTTTIQ